MWAEKHEMQVTAGQHIGMPGWKNKKMLCTFSTIVHYGIIINANNG